MAHFQDLQPVEGRLDFPLGRLTIVVEGHLDGEPKIHVWDLDVIRMHMHFGPKMVALVGSYRVIGDRQFSTRLFLVRDSIKELHFEGVFDGSDI